MPRGNRTGPTGMGAMTGRGAGYCAGFMTPGYMNPQAGGGRGRGCGLGRGRGGGGRGMGGGFGRGMGVGFGRGAAAAAALAPEQERTVLRNQLAGLEQTVAELRQRLSELKDDGAENK